MFFPGGCKQKRGPQGPSCTTLFEHRHYGHHLAGLQEAHNVKGACFARILVYSSADTAHMFLGGKERFSLCENFPSNCFDWCWHLGVAH